MGDLLAELGFAFLGNAVIVWVVVWAVGSAVIGCAVASWGRFPLWVGALVGGVGALLGLGVLLIVGAVRRSGVGAAPGTGTGVIPGGQPRWAARWSRRSGRLSIGVLIVIAVVLVATLLVDWVRVVAARVTVVSLPAWGTGLDGITLTLLPVVALALLLALRSPSRWAAVLMALVGSTMALIAALLGVILIPLNRLLGEFARLPYDSIGEFLESLGVDPADARLPLPGWFPSGLFGVDASGLSLAGIDMDAVLPAVTVKLGLGWVLFLVVAVLALAWACVEIAVAQRVVVAQRLAAAERDTGGFHSAPAGFSSDRPAPRP
ncbi:hypothetical protein GCM10022198_23850 [Klugiella xanthotipulae]|uniref:Uncharacterized protein n=1 Tax=Klugiella xanthotipulae TaxID=244735 RepID=A0A543I6G4_9MICO|nr:hypothetical protein [Klugiella xanthotipulae]TQM66168.1 hypothetical protein FB466_0998 [Klugiella xanthotipulae]